jgi:hypothetical protein
MIKQQSRPGNSLLHLPELLQPLQLPRLEDLLPPGQPLKRHGYANP